MRTIVALLLSCAITVAAPAQFQFQVLKSFGSDPTGVEGTYPETVTEGSDGYLYGTTRYSGGGYRGSGAIFQLAEDGSSYRVLHSFTNEAPEQTNDGFRPGPLLEASDGALYGKTAGGGKWGRGIIFRLARDGSDYAILHAFGENLDEWGGREPLIEGSDGWLYGCTMSANPTNGEVLFKMSKDGSAYAILHPFDFVGGLPARPRLFARKGDKLYGVTAQGGQAGWGSVFTISEDGTGYYELHAFGAGVADGRELASVILGWDGAIYGTTAFGGTTNGDYHSGAGTVFRLEVDGTGYRLLHSFAGDSGDGALAEAARGWSGAEPTLLLATDGTLYGTTDWGGENYAGTLFKVDRDGLGYSVLHDFAYADGAYPTFLLSDSQGRLFGATRLVDETLLGTVFTFDPETGNHTVLTRLQTSDGGSLEPTLTRMICGRNGTVFGIAPVAGRYWAGVAFALMPAPIRPRLLSVSPSISGVTIRFRTPGGTSNQLERALSLVGTWQTVTNLIAPDDGLVEVTDPEFPQPSALYRVRLSGP